MTGIVTFDHEVGQTRFRVKGRADPLAALAKTM
jgi:hypothetical protein